jgi:hypothetical protein
MRGDRDVGGWAADYVQGMSLRDIAGAHGAAVSTVRKKLIALGIPLRERRAAYRAAAARGQVGRPKGRRTDPGKL